MSLAFKVSSTMNSKEGQRGVKCSNTSPRRISRGSQTPKKKSKIRNEKKDSSKALSKESTIDPHSGPPPSNTPRASSVMDSNYSAGTHQPCISETIDVHYFLKKNRIYINMFLNKSFPCHRYF